MNLDMNQILANVQKIIGRDKLSALEVDIISIVVATSMAMQMTMQDEAMKQQIVGNKLK